MTRARVLGALAVGATLLTALAGCGKLQEWNPWASPTATAPPTDAPTPDAPPPTTPDPTTAPAPTSPTASTVTLGPLSGVWVGEWVNQTPIPGHGTFTLRWGQQGNQLFGTVTITGSNCLTSGSITGTVAGATLRFGAVEHSGAQTVSIDYTGTVAGADTLSGSYTSSCGPSEGTWSANRTAAAS